MRGGGLYLKLKLTTRMFPEIKMGSDGSHLNVWLTVMGKVRRHAVSTNHKLSEERGEPKWGMEPKSAQQLSAR